MKSTPLLPGQELYNHVRAGFILQNTTLSEWCLKNGMTQTSAKASLHGMSNGPKGKKLRDLLIKESNIENLTLNAA